MTSGVTLTGFDVLEKALTDDMPKAAAKAVLTRTLKKAAIPIQQHAQQLAPRGPAGKPHVHLQDRIEIKIVKAQRISRTKFAKQDGVTIAIGPVGKHPLGSGNPGWQEFGTVKQAAQPYMRPAADLEMDKSLDSIRDILGTEIVKTMQRMANKMAKQKKVVP